MQLGTRVEESGVAVREGERLIFRRHGGGRFVLDTRRVAIDALGVPIKLIGTYVGSDTLEVDRVHAI